MTFGLFTGGSNGVENAMAINGRASRIFFILIAIGLNNECNKKNAEHKKGGAYPAFPIVTVILFRHHDVRDS